MALSDDIAAVRSRTDLTDDQKRTEVYRLKGTALRDNLAGVVGTPLTLAEFVVTLTRLPQYDAARGLLKVWCTIARNGVPVTLNLPLCFVNPPIKAPTGPQGSMREDLRGAALRMLRDVVG
jgi:hypothetical protein